LSTLTLAVLARSGHPLDGRKRLKLEDLIAYPVASATEFPEGGPIGIGGCLICDNFHILRDVVEQTDCIWVSSPSFVSRQLNDGRLVRLDVEALTPSQIEVGIISAKDRTKSPAALALIDELRAVLERFEVGQE
jgi:DNA-binding transcriptional LysR family regulator